MGDRRRLPWLLSLPLILGGSFAAHAAGSHLFPPRTGPLDPDGGRELLQRADHGLITVVPVVAGLALALCLALMAGRVRSGIRPASRPGIPPSWFVVLPPVAFAIQELLERVLHAEAVLFNPVHEPAFLAGLALQLPFGALAYLVARALVGVGTRLARVLAAGAPALRPPRAPAGSAPEPAVRPRIPVLALGHSVRGPPLASVA
jgi:hypothetical protein